MVEFIIVSRSGCEYCISSSCNLSNLSNTVPNSFGISNKVLLGTSDYTFYLVFNNMGHSRKLKQMRLCADFNAGPSNE